MQLFSKSIPLPLLTMLFGCGPHTAEDLPGTWKYSVTESKEIRYIELYDRRWFTGIDSMNLGFQGDYRIQGDSLSIRGEMEEGGGRTWFVRWHHRDHLSLERADTIVSMQRVKL